MDDLARRERQVTAGREGTLIHHAEPALPDVVHQVTHPVGKASASRLEGAPQCHRVERQQQRRAHCIDELA